jgi:hypothetical protein
MDKTTIKVVADIQEVIRLTYFDNVRTAKVVKNGASSDSGDELEDVQLLDDRDKFQPADLHLFFKRGPTVVGGDNVYMHQDVVVVQKALSAAGGAGRKAHHEQTSVDLEEETHTKK